jgi:hypothetical protein
MKESEEMSDYDEMLLLLYGESSDQNKQLIALQREVVTICSLNCTTLNLFNNLSSGTSSSWNCTGCITEAMVVMWKRKRGNREI